MPIAKLKNENFFKIWSSDMAYVLGFFAADGNMRITKRKTAYIELTSCDKELLEKIKTCMNLEHVISIRKRSINWKHAYRIQIGSKKMYRDLSALGLTPRKSLIMTFPEIPDTYLSDFVRGYFDGDGCVSFTRYWRKDRGYWYWSFTSRFTSGSKQFLEKLWYILRLKVVGGHIHAKKKGGYDLVFSRHDSVALFEFMYNNVATGIYLERKYKIFQKAIRILKLGA